MHHGTSLANVLLFYTSGSQPFPPGTLNYTPGRFHDSKVPKRIICFFPQVTSLAWQDNQQNSQSLKPWTAPPSSQFSYSQCFPPSSHPLRQKQRLIWTTVAALDLGITLPAVMKLNLPSGCFMPIPSPIHTPYSTLLFGYETNNSLKWFFMVSCLNA